MKLTPKARKLKAKINKWDCVKLKGYIAKETDNKTKRPPTRWEMIFTNCSSDKGLISKVYRDLIKINTKQANYPIQKWAENLKIHLFQEDTGTANR